MVTPERLALPGTEEANQTALFAWAANPSTTAIEHLRTPKYPILDTMFAIPNGGLRNKIVAAKLKAAGAKAGVWDIFLPVPNYIPCQYQQDKWKNGLWIELKIKPNGLTKEQTEFRATLQLSTQFEWFVGYTWIEAATKILSYLGPYPR